VTNCGALIGDAQVDTNLLTECSNWYCDSLCIAWRTVAETHFVAKHCWHYQPWEFVPGSVLALQLESAIPSGARSSLRLICFCLICSLLPGKEWGHFPHPQAGWLWRNGILFIHSFIHSCPRRIYNPSLDLSLLIKKVGKGWWNDSSGKSACLAKMRPWIQTPVPQTHTHTHTKSRKENGIGQGFRIYDSGL
jgi:hypothetical protein